MPLSRLCATPRFYFSILIFHSAFALPPAIHPLYYRNKRSATNLPSVDLSVPLVVPRRVKLSIPIESAAPVITDDHIQLCTQDPVHFKDSQQVRYLQFLIPRGSVDPKYQRLRAFPMYEVCISNAMTRICNQEANSTAFISGQGVYLWYLGIETVPLYVGHALQLYKMTHQGAHSLPGESAASQPAKLSWPS